MPGYGYMAETYENHKTVLYKMRPGDDFLTSEICPAESFCEGDKIHIKIPKSTVEITDGNFSIEFKWADNMQDDNIMDFYVNGDAAPRGRLNYVYTFEDK